MYGMAGYSIVLNLSGNSVTQSERLADNLWRAQASATRLATALGAVSTAARSIPANPIRVSSTRATRTGLTNAVRTTTIVPQNRGYALTPNRAVDLKLNAAAMKMDVAATRMNVAATKQNVAANKSIRGHSRRGVDPFLSMGSSFSLGAFSGRLGKVFTPDENGRMFGMDATKLMKGANIASLAVAIVGTVAKTAAKVIAGATLAPMLIGGIGIMASLKYLQSESFAGGARLISRRHQAKLGLGEDYQRAEANTDFLAASYGFDRSTTLSSINTLTGLGVGGSNRKLNVAESTGLTKVGGLISQHHGVPFERVMTNIQQLLVQTTPHMRDIRELLNQAPILGKYALRDMEEKGVEGVDVRTYLKDQSNIISVLKRYELDVATNAGMQARGRIGLAQQDFHAKLAGNDPFWTYIGRAGSGVINSGGNAMDKILTTLANNDDFKIMVKQIEKTFDSIANSVDKWMPKILSVVERLAEKLGVDLGDRTKARLENDRESAIGELAKDPVFRKRFEQQLEAQGLLKDVAPSVRQSAINTFMRDALEQMQKSGGSLLSGRGPLYTGGDERIPKGVPDTRWGRRNLNEKSITSTLYNVNRDTKPEDTYVYYTQQPKLLENGYTSRGVSSYAGHELRNSPNANVAYTASYDKLFDNLGEFFKELAKVGTFNVDDFKGGGGDAGGSISGYNRDRRNLEIHFHAPIVEWNSTIQASSPQETVDEIAENMEQLTSAGLQKALLGASNKMSSRWY